MKLNVFFNINNLNLINKFFEFKFLPIIFLLNIIIVYLIIKID